MNKCYIISAGDFDGFYDTVDKSDLLIAADKGYIYAKDSNIESDIVVGDFDSSNRPDGENVITLNPIKDYTDTMAALMIAVEKGYKEIIIYGGLGGRDSHFISNIRNALKLKKDGINVSFKSKYKKIFIIDDKFTYEFKDSEENFYVSIFALENMAKSICIRNLFYELNNYDLSFDDSLGVSNETIGKDFSISLESGYLLVIFENKKM